MLEVARAPRPRAGDQGRRVVGLVPDQDPPAAVRPGAGRGDVAAEGDQHPDPQLGRPPPARTGRRPRPWRSRRGPADVGRDPDHPVRQVDARSAASRARAGGRRGGRRVRRGVDLGEVAVVAQGGERIAEGGVDRPAGGRAAASAPRAARNDALTRVGRPRGGQAPQLGVGAEPAAASSTRPARGRPGAWPREVMRVGDGQAHGGGPEGPLVRGPPQRQVAQAGGGHHDPPDCACGAPPAIPGCTVERDGRGSTLPSRSGRPTSTWVERRRGPTRAPGRPPPRSPAPRPRRERPRLPGPVRTTCTCTVHGASWGAAGLSRLAGPAVLALCRPCRPADRCAAALQVGPGAAEPLHLRHGLAQVGQPAVGVLADELDAPGQRLRA